MVIHKANIISRHTALYVYPLEMPLGKYYSCLFRPGNYKENDAGVDRMKNGAGAPVFCFLENIVY